MGRFLTFAMLVVLLWLTWLVLTGSTDPQELAVGAGAALLVAALRGVEPCKIGGARFLQPRRLLYAAAYIPYMVYAIVRANLDVARRVVDPRLPIRPGIVKVRTRLRNPMARMVLANSITLTPGTLTVDIQDEDLFIHWVDVETGDVEQATRDIAAGFERFLEVIFE